MAHLHHCACGRTFRCDFTDHDKSAWWWCRQHCPDLLQHNDLAELGLGYLLAAGDAEFLRFCDQAIARTRLSSKRNTSMGDRHMDLDNPGDCKAYADLYEREHKEVLELRRENRSLRDVNTQIRSERDFYKRQVDGAWSKPDAGSTDAERMVCGCRENRHPAVHWSVAPERWQEWAEALFEETGWTCHYGWPVPRATDDPKRYEPPAELYKERDRTRAEEEANNA